MESIAKQIRKGLATFTLAAIGMSFLTAPAAQARLDFTDSMEVPSWAEEAIEELMDQGVIHGNDDGSFAPNRQLNRAEVSKIITLASGVELDTTGGPHFPDVDEDAWYYDYIETMYNQGWINGYPDGYFRPAVGINRAEIAKMNVNAFEIDQDLSGAPHFDDVSSSDWFYGYVETAYNNGLMRGYGDGSFGPANAVTRAETVKIVYDSQLVVMEPEGPAEGTLEVVLSDYTPRGTNVPYNATSVPYTTIEMTASDDSDIEVSSLTFTRLGLGDNDDFDNVWLEIDGFKIGNDRSINNDDVVDLRFNPPIVVPAGQTLVADVVTSAKYNEETDDLNVGHHNRLAVVSADDVISTAANIVGDFPIEGDEMEVANYQVSSVQFSILGSDTTIDVGDNFIEIGKFRLLNQSTSNKDVELRALTFKNSGTAEIEDDLENVALYVSGEQISAETIVDGDYITFRLDNGVTGGYIIEDGDSKIFSIRADVVSAERADSITLKIDNFEDIVGVEIGTSFGIKAVYGSGAASGSSCTTSSNAEDSCATLKTYTIDSGDLNLSRDPASLGNQTYAPGSNDVVFMTARVVVDQPLIIDGLRVDVATGTTIADKDSAGTAAGDEVEDLNAAFDNYRFYLNDRLIDAENDFTGSSMLGAYLDFNTTFEIAGTSIIKVVGNVADAAESSDQVKLEITGNDGSNTSFSSPEYISTGDTVDNGQILGSASGSFVQVASSALDITRTDGLSAGDKIVAGVDDVEFLKFVLDNNDSGDVNITALSVTGSGTGKADTYTNFTAAVFVDGTQQGSAKNLATDGTATFNDLAVIIPSAGQKEFVVVVDTIESSAASVTATVGADPAAFVAGAGTVSISDFAEFIDNEYVYFTDPTADGADIDGDGDTTELGARILCQIDGTPTTANVAVDGCGNSLPSSAGTSTADLPADATYAMYHQLQLSVTDVDADNVENGSTVAVYEGGTQVVGTDELDSGNTLAGVSFELVQSGSLTVATGSSVDSNVLVANQSNVELLKVRFNAADDEVQIKDIYLENDVNGDGTADNTTAGDRVSFKLYNESGQLIQEKQMTGGNLHFELANQDRIRVPKDDSTYVTVKADVRDITKANQTGQRLLLALDADNATNSYGVEAVTASTGSDIDTPSSGWGDVTGNEFVAYRTEISVKPATNQANNFSGPNSSSQEIYRFTVTADSTRQAEIGRVSMKIDLVGFDFDGGNTFLVRKIKSDGNPDSTSNIGTVTSMTDADLTTGTAIADGDNTAYAIVDFTNEQLAAGEARSYALFVDLTTNETGSDTDDDSLTVSLLRDSAYSQPGTQANVEANGSGSTDDNPETAGNNNAALVWSDESSSSHSATTADWMNGYLLDVDTTGKQFTD